MDIVISKFPVVGHSAVPITIEEDGWHPETYSIANGASEQIPQLVCPVKPLVQVPSRQSGQNVWPAKV